MIVDINENGVVFEIWERFCDVFLLMAVQRFIFTYGR